MSYILESIDLNIPSVNNKRLQNKHIKLLSERNSSRFFAINAKTYENNKNILFNIIQPHTVLVEGLIENKNSMKNMFYFHSPWCDEDSVAFDIKTRYLNRVNLTIKINGEVEQQNLEDLHFMAAMSGEYVKKLFVTRYDLALFDNIELILIISQKTNLSHLILKYR